MLMWSLEYHGMATGFITASGVALWSCLLGGVAFVTIAANISYRRYLNRLPEEESRKYREESQRDMSVW